MNFSWSKDFRAVRALIEQDSSAGLRQLRLLLRAHPAQGFELEMIGRFLAGIAKTEIADFPQLRVAILAAYTSDPLANVFRVLAVQEGFMATIYESVLGTYRQEILDPNSGFNCFKPNVVLIAPSGADIEPLPTHNTPAAQIDSLLDETVDQWCSLWKTIDSRHQAHIVQHLLEQPEIEYLGIAERRAAWSMSQFVKEVNRRFIEVASSSVRWVDVDTVAARVGRRNWRDPRFLYNGQFGFSPNYLSEYLTVLGGALRNALARTSKALIVDLDNTLWGGVIGDDGLDGISLGPGSAIGEAYLAFCKYIKELGQRGVILGICSKNDLTIASEVFRSHPHMPLRLEDFAAVRCNWSDKASNIKDIATELNISLTSLVFVDDNPAECELVLQALPEVFVIRLAEDPAYFVRQVDELHLFDSAGYLLEDFRRTESYIGRAQSKALQESSVDLQTYLESLEMCAEIRLANDTDLPRLAQMEMKTNQFNLTTRRLTVEQLKSMATAKDRIVMVGSLRDRFTDHGLVVYFAVLFCDHVCTITDWLMSCRVFSRTLEHFTFSRIVDLAKQRGCSRIEINFRMTEKNKLMVPIINDLGFSSENQAPDGFWRYEVTENMPLTNKYIRSTSGGVVPIFLGACCHENNSC